jgi:hypothetical protein
MINNAYLALILGLIAGGLLIMNVDTDMVNQHVERFIVGELDEQEVHDQFDYFNSKYRKSYSNVDDHQTRYTIFKDNYMFITNHNKFNAEKSGYTLKVNNFADLTKQEFKDTYLRLDTSELENLVSGAQSQGSVKEFLKKSATDEAIDNLQIPSRVDWKTRGATTAVKNQGSCGSCWAFSAIAAIEGANYISRKRRDQLSEQQMVDCVTNEKNKAWYSDGCNGGIMHHVFEYAQTYPICTEAEYPYTGRQGTCSESKCDTGPIISHYTRKFDGTKLDLYNMLAKGPVSIALDASSKEFMFYADGIFASVDCTLHINHGVTATAYGFHWYLRAKNHYIDTMNSWGADWGNKGYMKISSNAEGQGGMCGIYKYAAIPFVKKR